MANRLTDHLSSDYFEASAALGRRGRRGRVVVYVEGYSDIPFWKSLFDRFETPERTFEVSTPVRRDLAKGKKVVLQFAEKAGKHLILCVDSDFDHLFGDATEQSRRVNHTPYLLQTYTYAVENYLCYPPSLHSVCARAARKDVQVFDFEGFMAEYSRIIHPLFLWYAYAARVDNPSLFTLTDFRHAARINFVNLEDHGEATLQWLGRNVARRLKTLEEKHQACLPDLRRFAEELRLRGVTPQLTHLYMQGHTLLDHVVLPLVAAVTNHLRKIAVAEILQSSRKGLPLNNELNYYNNSITDADELLLTNSGFHRCPLFLKLEQDMQRMLVGELKNS